VWCVCVGFDVGANEFRSWAREAVLGGLRSTQVSMTSLPPRRGCGWQGKCQLL